MPRCGATSTTPPVPARSKRDCEDKWEDRIHGFGTALTGMGLSGVKWPRAGEIASNRLCDRWRVGNNEQQRRAGEPWRETLHRGNMFVVIRLGLDQLERALLHSLCRKEWRRRR